MTTEDSANSMSDPTLRGRIKVLIVGYSLYILDEASTVAGHSSRYRWAQGAAQYPDQEVARLQPLVVMDNGFQTANGQVDDPTLKGIVETTVNKFI